MNPDFLDPKLCICGEAIDLDDEFCSKECEADYHDMLAMHQYERYLETQHTMYLNTVTGEWTS